MFTGVKAREPVQQDSSGAAAAGSAGGDAAIAAIAQSSSSAQMGESSWLLNDSAYNGTGARVLASSAEFARQLPEVRDVTRSDGSDDGSDSDVTALAARPPLVEREVELLSKGAAGMAEMERSYSQARTPSVATASLTGMHFTSADNEPSALSTYLASSASSPKARSLSASSLASFAADLLSDVSAFDTEEERTSEVSSDLGEADTWSGNSVAGSVSHLVMPTAPVEAGSQAASDRTSSSSGRSKAVKIPNQHYAQNASLQHTYRFLIVGGNGGLSLCKLCPPC